MRDWSNLGSIAPTDFSAQRAEMHQNWDNASKGITSQMGRNKDAALKKSANQGQAAGQAASNAGNLASTRAHDLATPTNAAPMGLGNFTPDVNAGYTPPVESMAGFTGPQQFATGPQAGFTAAPPIDAITSDEDEKKNIRTAKIKELLDHLKPKQYEYKEPNGSTSFEGENTGIIAQDLEKSKIGKTLVENTPDGKMVHYGKTQALVLSCLAYLNKKIEDK